MKRIVIDRPGSYERLRLVEEPDRMPLAGEIAIDAHGTTTALLPNEMVYLAGGVPHTIRAVKDAVALMTILIGPQQAA